MYEIKKINQDEAHEIFDSIDPYLMKYTYPKGLYYTVLEYEGKKIYVGIDNITNDAWAEEFETLEACKKWLARENDVESEGE